ncbi:hypothetical protein MHBO_002474, partial [Bonamia ostreae]
LEAIKIVTTTDKIKFYGKEKFTEMTIKSLLQESDFSTSKLVSKNSDFIAFSQNNSLFRPLNFKYDIRRQFIWYLSTLENSLNMIIHFNSVILRSLLKMSLDSVYF